MGKILLFAVNVMKANQIMGICKRLNHTVLVIPRADYGKPLGVLAGMAGKKNSTIYSGEEFADEMVVFSGIDSEALDIFLDEYKKAGIAPIQRKAVITPFNVGWTAEKLYKELTEHIL